MECGLGGAGPVTLIALHRTEHRPTPRCTGLGLSVLAPAGQCQHNDTWRAPVAKTFTDEIIVGKDLILVRLAA